MVASLLVYRLVFQSTLPVWGGTGRNLSIQPNSRYFNPPSPCGEGPDKVMVVNDGEHISIHPPRVGRDMVSKAETDQISRFQSTLPVWGGTPPDCTNSSLP